MNAAADHPRLHALGEIGRLLDEAIDLSDAAGETLVAAQIAQVLHVVDVRLAAIRIDPFTRDHGATGPNSGDPNSGVVEG